MPMSSSWLFDFCKEQMVSEEEVDADYERR